MSTDEKMMTTQEVLKEIKTEFPSKMRITNREILVEKKGDRIKQQSELIKRAVFARKTYRKEPVKVPRNALCPCGAGKKYKKCCGKPKEKDAQI